MIRILRGASWTQAKATTQETAADLNAITRGLESQFAFWMQGAEYAPSFQEGRWDGYIRLLRRTRTGGLRFPSGLVGEVVHEIQAAQLPVEVDDYRPNPPRRKVFEAWTGHELRPYQQEAVSAVLAADGGILKVAIRGGKTLIAARLAHELAVRTIFVVPSQLLLGQTAEVFHACLPHVAVTRVGDGDRDFSGDVVVATASSLMNHLDRANEEPYGLCIVDEVHHVGSDADRWRESFLGLEARTKVGLSATINVKKRGGTETAAIWARGICGPVVYETSMSDLIEQDHLVAPRIVFLSYPAPASDTPWSPDLYKTLLVDCQPRTDRAVRALLPHVARGERVLVDVARIPHARLFYEALRAVLPPGKVGLMIGDAPPKRDRPKMLRAFRDGALPVIVGNLLGEGVDVPELQVVVNGEAGKGENATIQRLRNLTVSAGKEGATVYDFLDLHHPTLAEWTQERFRLYTRERAFRVEVEER